MKRKADNSVTEEAQLEVFYDGLQINDMLMLEFAPGRADELFAVEEGKREEEIAQLSKL